MKRAMVISPNLEIYYGYAEAVGIKSERGSRAGGQRIRTWLFIS